jgi:hypothetical protein
MNQNFPYLIERGGLYYVRLIVPKALRGRFIVSELQWSLRTTEKGAGGQRPNIATQTSGDVQRPSNQGDCKQFGAFTQTRSIMRPHRPSVQNRPVPVARHRLPDLQFEVSGQPPDSPALTT